MYFCTCLADEYNKELGKYSQQYLKNKGEDQVLYFTAAYNHTECLVALNTTLKKQEFQ